jgi:putative FmdB family regulatory protein
MPVYTYRREDGTTFEYRQKFLDDPLQDCPTTGQRVVRIVQNPGVIFKGSGFYVNDSKSASKQSLNGTAKKDGESPSAGDGGSASAPAKPETPTVPSSAAAD